MVASELLGVDMTAEGTAIMTNRYEEEDSLKYFVAFFKQRALRLGFNPSGFSTDIIAASSWAVADAYREGHTDGRSAVGDDTPPQPSLSDIRIAVMERRIAEVSAERDRWLKRMQDLEGRVVRAELALSGKNA